MKIKTLFNIAYKCVFAVSLFLLLGYIIGFFVEGKFDISVWRQGLKDTIGIISALGTVITGIIITVLESDK